MGIVTMGIPKEMAIELARLNNSTIFVETGTFHGGTTRWASNNFETVHTIERAESLYNLHSKELSKIKEVIPHFGDSRDILPQIVKDIRGQRAIFWLDGHWSGGKTAGEYDECPLLDEMTCLSNCAEDIIMIDDARLFLCAPPLPHNPSQWPTIPDIVNALPASAKRSFVQIVDDVIFIVPREDALRNCLVGYAQRRSNDFWREFVKGKSSPKKYFRSFLSGIKRRITTGYR
ncbi:MAG: hypothetical protein GY755_16965 [Chloroflexi bacterium]|nr:hypothetical protein [Chloroflexota bacterium]